MDLAVIISRWTSIQETPSVYTLTVERRKLILDQLKAIKHALTSLLEHNVVLAGEIRNTIEEVEEFRSSLQKSLDDIDNSTNRHVKNHHQNHQINNDNNMMMKNDSDIIDKICELLQVQTKHASNPVLLHPIHNNTTVQTFLSQAHNTILYFEQLWTLPLHHQMEKLHQNNRYTKVCSLLQRCVFCLTNQMQLYRKQATMTEVYVQQETLTNSADKFSDIARKYKHSLMKLLCCATPQTKKRTIMTTETKQQQQSNIDNIDNNMIIDSNKNGQYFNNTYKILRTLRDTLFGKLKLGIIKNNNVKVAIKFSNKVLVHTNTTTQGSKVLESVIGEMNTLRSLNMDGGHNNILKLVDEVEDHEYYYTILEFCDSGELFDNISNNGPMTNEKAKASMVQVANAIYYMHNKNYCHLDISLENILVTSKNEMKLCDFGLTRYINDRKTKIPGILKNKPGKLGYMSPELFAGSEFCGFYADVWSFGIVLFTVLTGIPPMKVPSLSDARFKLIINGRLKHLLKAWKLLDSLDPLVVELLCKMLAPEERRITMYDVVNDPWMKSDMI